MKIDDVIAALELDKETADILRAKVKAESAERLSAKRDLDEITNQKNALEQELVADGKKGARAYKQWYEQNFSKIQDLQTKFAKYVERYGDLDSTTQTQQSQQTQQTPKGFTQADFDNSMAGYTKQWSSLVKGIAQITTKHQRNGRKTDIDVDAITQLANERFNGDITAAYDEWDKPEAEKARTAAEEKRINDEVEKRLKARAPQTGFFPSTEQVSTGVSPLGKDRESAPKYDRSKVIESALTGIYEPSTVQ